MKCWLWCWTASQPESSRKAIKALNVGVVGWGEEDRKANKAVRTKILVQEGWGGGVDPQFPVYLPPPPPLSLSLPLTPHSFSLPLLLSKPVAISDFLGNLSNNTSERDQDSDTHNKPPSVTLNPAHRQMKIAAFFCCLWVFLGNSLKQTVIGEA